MRILPVTQNITSEIKKVENAKKIDRTTKTSASRKSDRSELSANAQRLSETQASAEMIAPHVLGQADVREDRIEEVRQKIESGYYNTPEFMDKLAGKLISDLGLS